MKPISVERRWLLKSALAAALGLIGSPSLAEVLLADDDTLTGGDGVLAAQMRLGELLIRHLAGHKEAGANDDAKANANTNVVVSPASVAAILSLLDLGGSAEMHQAIHRTIGFKKAARRKAEKDLRQLRSSVSAIIAKSRKDGPLVMANLVAFDRSTKPKQVATYTLSGAGADVLVDNLGDARVVDRINAWVDEKTRHLIPAILDEAPEAIGLVAINALYFKDKWQTPFEPSRTKTEPFHTVSGAPVEVQMMHSQASDFRFRQDDRFIAAELGYANENFRLVVATTKEAPARPQEFAAVAGWLSGEGFAAQDGEIALPRMSLSARGELLPPLDALGLAAARRSPDALEGFSDEPLVIRRILQKVELRVNEEGTEGAAATAVMTVRGLQIGRHIKMVVDKPFVFALRDDRTGLVLFMGYVGSPPQTG
jgi:serpin B